MKIVKQSLTKAKKSGLDSALALLCLRTTPIDGKSKSPAELLLGRQLQDNLPRRQPRNPNEADHFEHLVAKQQKQKQHHDEHARAKPLSPVVPSQPVVVRNPATNNWAPATVKSTDQNRSVTVETPHGTTLRRNRIDIRPAPKQVRFAENDEETAREVNKEADKPTASSPSKPSVFSGCQTRSGRVVKAPDRLDL